MTFWDHLDELRGVLFRSVAVLMSLFVILFFFKSFIFDTVVLSPASGQSWLYRLLGVDLKLDLINIDVTAQFFIHMRVTFIAAFIVGFPFVVYQLWSFIVPALYDNEIRVMKRAFALGGGLFYSGVAMGYFIVIPLMLVFFNGYQVSDAVTNTFSLSSYISLFSGMVFTMGILFEFPSVLAVLSHFGVIDRGFLRKYRRHAIVVILILAAALTPSGDPFTMLVVALPLYALYEGSILICRPASSDIGR